MRKYRVRFLAAAEADLFGLYQAIADEGGNERAGAYIDRIEAACVALETLPRRGRARDDIHPGLRTVGFECRATIAFRVTKAEVIIARIFYGGQDYERVLRDG